MFFGKANPAPRAQESPQTRPVDQEPNLENYLTLWINTKRRDAPDYQLPPCVGEFPRIGTNVIEGHITPENWLDRVRECSKCEINGICERVTP